MRLRLRRRVCPLAVWACAGLLAAASSRQPLASPLFLWWRRSEGRPWYSADGDEIAEEFEGGSGETPAWEHVAIEMSTLPKGRLGVNLQKGKTEVNRVLYPEAFNAGWRVGDSVLKVNGAEVDSNEAVMSAVQSAIAAHNEDGAPLRIEVRRWAVRGTARGMVRMSAPEGLDHVVPMLDLTRGLVQDYPVVLFVDGLSRQSSQAIQLLDAMGVAFKAVDCADEEANPGLRSAVSELTGARSLPKLFVGGELVADAWLRHGGMELEAQLRKAGATFRQAVPA